MEENDSKKDGKRSFWTTVPGILTGIAAVLGAIGTLVTVLYAAGIIGPSSVVSTPTTIQFLTSSITLTPSFTPTRTATPTEAPSFTRVPDSDGDGYRDNVDSCPSQGNQGNGVDSTGCPNPVPDSDGDGYRDNVDSCPSQGSQGYGVDSTGCPNPVPDSDGDGYRDNVDSCPSQGNQGYGVDSTGCPNPVPDSDGDGYRDNVDSCPSQGNQGNGVDSTGCPISPPQIGIQEDCIPFNPSNTAVRDNGDGTFTITDGPMAMLYFDTNSALQEANTALDIIRYYGLDDQCFVGRPDPSLEYFLVNGSAPEGTYPGEDCIYFTPNNISVTYVSSRWKIVEGDHWILDFDQNESEARQSYEIIQSYGFQYICFVGRPEASMIYLRR